MKICLQRKNNFDHDYTKDMPLFYVNDDIDLFQFLLYENKYYIIGRINRQKGYSIVEEVMLNQSHEDCDYEQNIKCPYCSYEDQDSWEASDENDKQECGRCGSIFSYQREVEITYKSQPVKMSPIIKIK